MSTITMERQSWDAGFREADYLRNNPDVAQAVRQGQFASGWDHFQRYGRLEGRARPSPGKVFDHIAGASRRGTAVAWAKGAEGDLAFIHSFAQAKDMWNRAATDSGYIDVHCWRFTPASFHLLLSDLQGLGLTRLGVFNVFPPAGCEFYATLGRLPEGERHELDRLAVLKLIQEER